MLNICGSNFVPVLITMLCCAGLFMYFNLRIVEIKTAVEKQNRVLTAFITNVQQDIKTGGGCMLPTQFNDVGMNHIAAPEAIIAAQTFTNNKIIVSDDSDSDDSDSDDSDSDDSDSDDSDSDVIKPVFVCDNDQVNDITIINLATDLNIDDTFIPIAFEVLSCGLVINNKDIGEEKANESSIVEITDTAPAAYEQLKVDELRKIVLDKNLATKEEVKKLKKPELLALLK